MANKMPIEVKNKFIKGSILSDKGIALNLGDENFRRSSVVVCKGVVSGFRQPLSYYDHSIKFLREYKVGANPVKIVIDLSKLSTEENNLDPRKCVLEIKVTEKHGTNCVHKSDKGNEVIANESYLGKAVYSYDLIQKSRLNKHIIGKSDSRMQEKSSSHPSTSKPLPIFRNKFFFGNDFQSKCKKVLEELSQLNLNIRKHQAWCPLLQVLSDETLKQQTQLDCKESMELTKSENELYKLDFI